MTVYEYIKLTNVSNAEAYKEQPIYVDFRSKESGDLISRVEYDTLKQLANGWVAPDSKDMKELVKNIADKSLHYAVIEEYDDFGLHVILGI